LRVIHPSPAYERHTSMTPLRYLAAAFLCATAIAGGHAQANTCRADPLICPTTMPVDGYCECTAHGAAMSGTVTATGAPAPRYNAAGGGCGADPNDPGCRPMPTQPAVVPIPPPAMSMQPPLMPPPSMPPPPMPPPD
jgi:hypothetical protein